MGLSRRWILAAGVTGTVVAAVATGAVAANAGEEKPASRPAASSTTAAPASQQRLGKLAETGIAAQSGTWVLYAVPVHDKSMPGTTFGVMAGRRLPDGSVTDVVMANEFDGSDRAPGFHAVQGAMEIDGERTPTFGYFVGDPAKINARAAGRTVEAHRSAWSEDASVTFFWFDLKTAPVDDLRAYGSDGRALTTGHSQVSVG